MICPICEVNGSSTNNEIKNIWGKTDQVLFCDNCEIYFLKNVPDQIAIEEYYKKECYHFSRIVYYVKNIFRKFRSASQVEYIKSNIASLTTKKILEIDACGGLFPSYFRDNFVSNLEYSPVYMKVSSKKYGINSSNGSFFDLSEKFDLIILSHVIEHLPDLNAAVSKLKDLLNEGGYLFIEVSNSPKRKERDVAYINNYLTTPYMYNFTQKSLREIFIKYNFNALSLDRFFYNFPDSYSDRKKEKLAEIFLGCSKFEFKYLFSICRYLFENIVDPNKSFRKIGNDLEYVGFGDNIRIILKK